MVEWNDWSEGWLKEGYYISYLRDQIRYYEHIVQRDFGHWEYDWPETITTRNTSGPFTPAEFEITRGYDVNVNTNQIWQVIFGIKSQVYIYIELPTDTHRHGIPKRPKPSSTDRQVSHFTEWMSPFLEPSFITEHFMMRPETQQISFDAFNPCAISLTDVTLNIMINKIVTERIGTVQAGVQTPINERWRELLDRLYRGLIPCRPITLQPVRAPAEAPAGE